MRAARRHSLRLTWALIVGLTIGAEAKARETIAVPILFRGEAPFSDQSLDAGAALGDRALSRAPRIVASVPVAGTLRIDLLTDLPAEGSAGRAIPPAALFLGPDLDGDVWTRAVVLTQPSKDEAALGDAVPHTPSIGLYDVTAGGAQVTARNRFATTGLVYGGEHTGAGCASACENPVAIGITARKLDAPVTVEWRPIEGEYRYRVRIDITDPALARGALRAFWAVSECACALARTRVDAEFFTASLLALSHSEPILAQSQVTATAPRTDPNPANPILGLSAPLLPQRSATIAPFAGPSRGPTIPFDPPIVSAPQDPVPSPVVLAPEPTPADLSPPAPNLPPAVGALPPDPPAPPITAPQDDGPPRSFEPDPPLPPEFPSRPTVIDPPPIGEPVKVPEPASIGLMLAGLGWIGWRRRLARAR